MNHIAIRSRCLGKRYRVGGRIAPYRTLRETVSGILSTPLRLGRRHAGSRSDAGGDFWALRDVSFDIPEGEVVGVVGSNGAGKSTLLKVLSRITDPTTGFADIRGRVSSLLEVGTGFHPELTGRENTYLNGAILGMRRDEIRRKFDEIVAFAEVERFVDTPVKHYSSGMYLRLAFAVAVHLEADVLFVDEVLAVGDAQFQRKCFRKMREVSRKGLTILFVSHNMASMREICTRGVALDRGRVVKEGGIDDVADWYVARATVPEESTGPVESKGFRVEGVEITSRDGPVLKTFGDLRIAVHFRPKRDVQDPSLVLTIMTAGQVRIGMLNYKDLGTSLPIPSGQRATMGFEVEDLPLLAGSYFLEVVLKDRVTNEWDPLPMLYPFEVVETPVYGGRMLGPGYGHIGFRARVLDPAEQGVDGPGRRELTI